MAERGGDNHDMQGIHWVLDILQSIDVGLMVLDRDYGIQTWNLFMENHSNLKSTQVLGSDIFSVFPDLPVQWFRNKVEAVFTLDNPAYITWEQRPHVFPFRSYRPVTSTADFMYQNITIIPLHNTAGMVDRVVVMVYDVTDSAVSRLELQQANEELARLSRIDGLTKLTNRGCWDEDLAREFARCQRYDHSSSLVILDIDHFKRINDSFGHQVGDEVIRTVSRLLREYKRTPDLAGRYGGEEFAVILVDTDVEGAHVFAERLRQRVEAARVMAEGTEVHFTISLGIAPLMPHLDSSKQWVEMADKALYTSKRNGRNQTTLYSAACETVH